MREEIDTPDEVTATIDHLELTVEGPNGSVTRRLWYPDGQLEVVYRRRDLVRCVDFFAHGQ